MKSFVWATVFAMMAMAVVPGFTVTAYAQSSKGIIVGTIADPNGAVIGGATVKITNLATGVVRETTTTDNGNYRLDAVDPGTYKVEVSADGFKTIARDNVIVAAAQATTVDFALEVGTTGEVVNVVADNTVILQQQDGARTNTLEQREITDLPVVGLNPVNLVFTLPGVVQPSVLSGGFVQGTEFSINGLRPRANNQLIDGTDNNDNSITGQQLQPILRDGYREVTILGSNYSAEYGRAGGAVVNVVTQSGTNQFHGSVYDVFDTSALASLSSGQKANEGLTKTPVYTQNSFGFSLGGPIVRDKLFFFGTFQPTLTRSGGVSASAVIPTDAGFARLRQLFPQGSSPNLDRYLSVIGDLRGSLNTFNVDLGNGRGPVEFGTVTVQQTQPVDTYDLLGRVDWAPNEKNSFAFRYLFQDQVFSNQFPTPFDGFAVDVTGRVQNAYVNWTRVISARMTNEARFSYGRFHVLFGPRDPNAVAFGPEFQFADVPISGVGDLGGLSGAFPQGRTFNNFQLQDTITYTRGTHTIRAGMDVVRQKAKQLVPFNGQGILTFSAGGGFNGFANFVDGFSGTQGAFAAKSFGDQTIYPDAWQQAYFINDSWRIKPNFTLNLGLRYENYGTPYNVVQYPAFPGLDRPFDTVVRQERDNNNFAPRISFAWTPRVGSEGMLGRIFGEDKTVIRGGYAVGYDVFFNNILSNTAATSPNVFGVTVFGNTGSTARGIAGAGVNSLPTTGAPNPLAGVNTILPNLVNPQTHLWNFGIQRELPGNFIFDTAYVGSRGMRLFINEQMNPVVNGVRINPNRGPITARTNGGDSNYHSWQTRLERGFRNGFLGRFTYTWSKTIDNTNSEVFTTTGGSSFGSDPFNRRADRGVAAYDIPHAASVSFVWDVPGPRQGLIGQVLGYWTLSGIYNIQSGAVETVSVQGIDLNGDGNAFNDRPSIGNPNAPANSVAFAESLFGAPSPTGYFDLDGNVIDPNNARYIVDPAIRTNVVGRNTLRADRLNHLNLSVNKAFVMPFEGHRLDVRFDFFNVLNHPNYTWAVFGTSDVGDGNVLNPFFNRFDLNDGGIIGPTGNRVGRYGRVQVRYSF